MKRLITITLMLIMVFTSCAFSAFASSSSTKYVKVKKATYQKYKKAYKKQGKLKKEIRTLEKKLALKQMDYEDAMDQYELAMEDAENKKAINDWLWMNVKSLGITYKNKTWTVPNSFPEKFMVNGTTYTVTKEAA